MRTDVILSVVPLACAGLMGGLGLLDLLACGGTLLALTRLPTTRHPIDLTTTLLHELGHALVAWLTRGRVVALLVRADASGQCSYVGGHANAITVAGYVAPFIASSVMLTAAMGGLPSIGVVLIAGAGVVCAVVGETAITRLIAIALTSIAVLVVACAAPDGQRLVAIFFASAIWFVATRQLMSACRDDPQLDTRKLALAFRTSSRVVVIAMFAAAWTTAVGGAWLIARA